MRGKFVLFPTLGQLLNQSCFRENQVEYKFEYMLSKNKFAKHFNITRCYAVLTMTSARALHVRFVNYKVVKL